MSLNGLEILWLYFIALSSSQLGWLVEDNLIYYSGKQKAKTKWRYQTNVSRLVETRIKSHTKTKLMHNVSTICQPWRRYQNNPSWPIVVKWIKYPVIFQSRWKCVDNSRCVHFVNLAAYLVRPYFRFILSCSHILWASTTRSLEGCSY